MAPNRNGTRERRPPLRATLHYCLLVVILAVYGVQVCPFLETLTPLELGLPLVVVLAVQWLARKPLHARLVLAAPYAIRARRAVSVELSLFAAGGLLLAAFNTVAFGFPVESGSKVVIGFLSLGFFVAIDLALEVERDLAHHFHQAGLSLEPEAVYFPVSRKLALFAAASAIVVTTVLFLVVNKDLDWLSRVGKTLTLQDAQMAILVEFTFVAGVILAHVLNVIRSYARNLRFFLDAENALLARANQGDLSGSVPASTSDEFGVMAHHTNRMVAGLRMRTEEVQRTQDVTILGLATLAETRDNETGAHILRTQRYVRALADHLKDLPGFRDVLDEATVDLLYKSAPLHDVGKVGIPDAILLKPGKLTEEEFEIMKTHAQLGSEAIHTAERELGEETSFLRFAREIAETHHEKWDGSGYPKGLQGTAIPLSGRLMAVADVYDALISKRVYKPAFPHEKAKELILDGRVRQFDPDVVDAFVAVEAQFKDIAASFTDAKYGTDD
jgi:HD-GYP domain-containing protein (c-di-GMP phosphodiesterase class II)